MISREEIDASLAARLIASQFPQWADLPVRPVALSGLDNRTFHLGETMLVRLPSHASYADQVAKEHAWLPRLAPQLPLPIPTPLAKGAPQAPYPWSWSVYAWIEGEPAQAVGIGEPVTFARDLAAFLNTLYELGSTGGPPPGAHNFWRGASLSTYDAQTRDALGALEGRIDVGRAMTLWEAALASHWIGPPVWTHGDIAPGNLLMRDGRLAAVIDFGCSCVGDPACDLAIAWTTLRGEARTAFREGLGLDDGTWLRGAGWALWKAAIVAAGVSRSVKPGSRESWETLAEILAAVAL